ncbi:MAG: ABC transporter substrate-binding protein [Candidatus Moduliflexus flocculans]|nr:ABC transporter substrate-binding protein [Candidatus Moduliflexus flocculans]
MPDINMTMAKNAGIKSMGGAKITLIFKDHEGNPTLGADLAKKLILDDKVHGLMGAYHSAVTKAVSAVAEQYGVPLINDSSTSPELTKPGLQVVLAHHPARRLLHQGPLRVPEGHDRGQGQGRGRRAQEGHH